MKNSHRKMVYYERNWEKVQRKLNIVEYKVDEVLPVPYKTFRMQKSTRMNSCRVCKCLTLSWATLLYVMVYNLTVPVSLELMILLADWRKNTVWCTSKEFETCWHYENLTLRLWNSKKFKIIWRYFFLHSFCFRRINCTRNKKRFTASSH